MALRASSALARTRGALSRRHNWLQLARFCAVGASGYVVNLAVYTLLLRGRGRALPARRDVLVPRRGDEQLHVEPALDVPRRARPFAYQGLRFLVVSTIALGANLLILHVLVEELELGKVVAQAIAIVLVTPLNFVGNKLWSFGRR